MKTSKIILASAAVMALTVGCKTNQVVTTPTGEVKTESIGQTESVIHKLLIGTWTVSQVGNEQVTGTERPYVEFGQDPSNPFIVQCYAYNGCNYINGAYAITPGGEMKRTTDFISTMMMCEGARYEVGVTEALNNVTRYAIETLPSGYTLKLYGASEQPTICLKRFTTEFINGAWDVTSIAGVSVDSDLGIQLVIDLSQHSIHGNAGCNTINGKVTTNPDVANSISFSDIASTRMTCPAIETEMALLKALQTVVDVQPGRDVNSATLRTASGTAAVTLHRANI